MLFKKKIFIGIVIILSLLLSGCGSSAPSNQAETKTDTNAASQGSNSSSNSSSDNSIAEPIDLKWGTIQSGGAWQILGNAFLEDIKNANPQITGSTVPSSTTANVMGVHTGEFNIAFSLGDTTADAWQGEGYFQSVGKINNIRNIATFYPQSTHIVVYKNSGIDSIADLKGKRISPGPKGTSNDIELQRLLQLYGMSYDDVKITYLSFDDATQQMIDGHLDVLAYITVPAPYASVVNISSQKEIKLLSLPEDKVAEMTKYQGVMPYTLPAGIYNGVDYEVHGISTPSHLIVRDDMPDDVVYNIVKAIAENFDRYENVLASMKYATLEGMATDVGIPFHPGAEKFYREKGWLK